MTDVDCIADSFEPEVFEGNKRNLTVGYASRYPDYQRIPSVVMKGCIVLTACEAEADEVMETARVVGKLSVRKRRQVREFIGVIGGKF